MVGHEEKAKRYIGLLDAARVNASWSEVPELIRKVNKHAPHRKVLVQTATAEHSIAVPPSQTLASTASSAATKSDPVATLAETLRTEDGQPEEDLLQGKTCVLWTTWTADFNKEQTTTLGADVTAAARALKGKPTTTWTKICLIKAAYIEGMRKRQHGNSVDAQSIWSSAAVMVEENADLALSTPQLSYWSQQLLGQLAFDPAQTSGAQTETAASVNATALRGWAALASKSDDVPASKYGNSSAHLPRVKVWRKYYEYISSLVRIESDDKSHGVRLQRSAELLQVEKQYENELLRVCKFPKATESNQVIEEWVEQVMANWRLLCGPDWRESDLPEGGRHAIGRNVLDILYRAATKTFHSALILRRLFHVHKSLAEFDLAYRSLDTYIELVERAKSRAAKSGQEEPGDETNDVAFLTVAEGIEGLCEFGRLEEAEKAHTLATRLEDWLSKIGIEDFSRVLVNGEVPNGHAPTTALDPHVLELVYRAIGVGKAHWARWTPYSEKRSDLQEQAVVYLKRACSHRDGESQAETYYAMALLLAETRAITEATAYIKKALQKLASTSSTTSQFVSERKSVPLWHLLGLLLTSRHEFDNATKSCAAALEQFPSGSFLVPTTSASSVATLNQADASSRASLVGNMECDELHRMVEVRITELALTELADGPEEAVNHSNELLAMFSHLFAHLDLALDNTTGQSSVRAPPSSAGGTIKTTRSIFGRKKAVDAATSEKQQDASSIKTDATRPGTTTTTAPSIQVTNEEGAQSSPKPHGHHPSRERSRRGRHSLDLGQKKLVRKSSQRNSQTALAGSDTAKAAPSSLQSGDIEKPAVGVDHAQSPHAKQELRDVPHNLGAHHDLPPPASHARQPPEQDVRLPTVHPFTNSTSPIPRFSKTAAQKHALTILVKVWLLIASLYRRANMFDDSKEACEEAGQVASKIEALVSAVESSARAFAETGWGGGGKSVDEVWADVYCERAELHLAIYNTRQSVGQIDPTHARGLQDAVEGYEQCLMFAPNHVAGVIGLSNLLLDYYEKKIDLGQRVDDGRPKGENPLDAVLKLASRRSVDSASVSTEHVNGHAATPVPAVIGHLAEQTPSVLESEDLKKSPDNLNRIAARDRAYGLLSTVTRLGCGWDNSEAWYALARAHELGGELEKAKGILWWCIELEDTRPIRHWRNLGYSLR